MHVQANVRVNFGPSFIKKPEIAGANAVSELQPMNPEDRKVSGAVIVVIVQLCVGYDQTFCLGTGNTRHSLTDFVLYWFCIGFILVLYIGFYIGCLKISALLRRCVYWRLI